MIDLIGFPFVALVLLRVVLGIIHDSRPSPWFCREMDWHDPSFDVTGFDGNHFTSRCIQCGDKILMDGCGGWRSGE